MEVLPMERGRPGRGLMPLRPLRDLEEMQRRFDDILGWPFLPAVWRRIPTMEMGSAPVIDVFEKDDKFMVKAELPGMKETDISISVVGDTSTIKGEHKAASDVKEDD
jgi:HSP20 family protein